jgi:hypothetical protein
MRSRLRYAGPNPFRLKFALLGDATSTPPQAARIVGGLSAVLCITIIFAGRWVGFD